MQGRATCCSLGDGGMGRSENMLRGRVPSQSCLFFMHRQDPAMLRAVPGRWWLHRKAPPRWARGPWSRGGHLEALLGAGAEPARKVPLTPSSGVGAGRQRGPVRSVWEHTATTTGHEIGSSGATPPRGRVSGVATGSQPERGRSPPHPASPGVRARLEPPRLAPRSAALAAATLATRSPSFTLGRPGPHPTSRS